MTINQVGSPFFNGKRVLVRVDFNVPQNPDLSIADDSRIRATLPTINFLKNAGARVILMSHLGRPRGRDLKLSLAPVAAYLSKLIGQAVEFIPDCIGEDAEKLVRQLKDGQICLLENLRFYPEEEKNTPEFARQLASLGEVYVNDAFGAAHRAHASTQGVTSFLRPALAGLLMQKELEALSKILKNPERPFAMVIGGAKVSTKVAVLENLIQHVDILVIGGAMSFTFLKARGINIGKSLVEEDRVAFCLELERQAKDRGVKLILPVDVVCALDMKSGSPSTIYPVESIPTDQMGLDLGPSSSVLINDALKKAATIVWNGPLGVFEMAGFEKATGSLIDTLVALTKCGAKTIVGGGDSIAAIDAHGTNPGDFTHVSTGGGATLEFLSGIELPGVACLDTVPGLELSNKQVCS